MRKNIYYYEPEWKHKIRLAFQLALPINDAWQIISISQAIVLIVNMCIYIITIVFSRFGYPIILIGNAKIIDILP